MKQLLLISLFVIRDLARNWKMFAMVIVSLTIASVSILTTDGVLAGFRAMLESGARGWLGDIVVMPPDDRTSLRHASDMLDDIRSLRHADSGSIRSSGTGGLKYRERISYPYGIIGMDSLGEAAATGIPYTVIEGAFFGADDDPDGVVLGAGIADSFIGGPYDGDRVHAGDDVDYLGNDGTVKRYRVRGIIDAKTFLPNWSAIMQKSEVERLPGSYRNTSIVIKASDEQHVEILKETIRSRHPDAIVHTWYEESGYVTDILKTVGFITSTIIWLLVASVFVIVAIVVFINVSQQKRQIGIMKSMGATTAFIVSIYTMEAVMFFSVAFVAAIGIFLALHSFSASHPTPMLIGDFHTVIEWSGVRLYFSILLCASFLGGAIPSFRIANQRIIDAIRNV